MRALGDNTQKVWDYFRAHPGKQLTVGQVAAATGIESKYVANSCGVLVSRDRKMRRVSIGLYEYRQSPGAAANQAPPGLPLAELVEVIGHDGNGNFIGRAEDGALYRIAPL